ncbi:MAG: hypothetical protein Sapg2KO_50250 [Saprospiraceae bacterium]
MEALELEHNDYVTYIFIFTVNNGECQYYFSDKEYWFMDNWQYQEIEENKNFIEVGLEKVKDDKIEFSVIQQEYRRLSNEKLNDAIISNLPMLYVDFDKKIMKSRYFEQSLHDKVIEGWLGSYEDFLTEIPKEYNYWKEVTNLKMK